MSLLELSPGDNLPHNFNVIIEIPQNSVPIKYEVDKDSGVLFVDRIMSTAMYYPANYGYIPQSLSLDGDPVDVLVVAPYAIQNGAVIACRAIGMLEMEDDAGIDAKILAVPVSKVCPLYDNINSLEQLQFLCNQIEHFFSHYKDLEKGKWVKIKGWANMDAAHQEITKSIQAYQLQKLDNHQA
jgi:inorganic pyrophosphatase